MYTQNNKKTSSIFPIAKTFPDFFKENLLDDNRVIKLLKGSCATQRVFYYQLLKLVHQIENDEEQQEQQNYQETINKVIANYISNKDDEEEKLELQKQKAMVEYFLQFLSKNDEINFEEYIQQHKEIDHAFLSILGSMIQDEDQLQIIKDKLTFLSERFNMNINQYSDCLKFEQSDIFVYILNENQLYLAFLNYGEDEPPEIQSNISLEKIEGGNYEKELSKKIKNDESKKNDTIMNIFGDMLQSSKNQPPDMVSNSLLHGNLLNTSLTPKKDANKTEQFSIREVQPEFQGIRTTIKQASPPKQKVSGFVIQKQEEPIVPQTKYILSKYDKINEYFRQQVHQKQKIKHQQQDLFYNPKPQKSSLTQSKLASKLYNKRKDPLDYEDSKQKGTFYRQFTETKILNLLPQPQRSKVKMMKNRFIGVHNKQSNKY